MENRLTEKESRALQYSDALDAAAWFKKGSGTVVRSTLRVVPATVPAPFLNHAQSGAVQTSSDFGPLSSVPDLAQDVVIEIVDRHPRINDDRLGVNAA